MSLRRFAQENHAGVTGSPRTSASQSTNSSPKSPLANPPSTPRNRPSIGIYRSPASTPSISSSIPFDWEAARSRRPPPYGTPQNKIRKSMGVPNGDGTPARRAVVRKKSLYERITSIPSTIAFEIALFPHNVPLPSPKTSAKILGGAMHFFHFCTRVSQIRKVPDSDLGWEDMYREGEGTSWFDWTVPVTLLLIFGSVFNTAYLFSRTRIYQFHKRIDPLSSPNAKTIAAELDVEPLKPPSLGAQLRAGAWYAFSYSWRWLLGMKPPQMYKPVPPKMTKVQQLLVWNPGELELELFSLYSPIHALLWLATSSSNWILMFFVMGLTSVQLNILIHSYGTLVKDKELVAAEVMHEYNEGFVYPRVNPIRKDVAVMTHQSEMVNVWED
ncbi:hypothetical protein P691DRAFT_806680 [Macrolepiota fuliginosa MF-IS2]|uniref:Nuclear rim protein 1 n=1 Tax=Macrolepiota fuliginosa MF-IS2 TaxID=1400762 RepID=A0A9P5XPS7_9AGAR|nr:hypothetical protein P691DRAFT_806680 [Macrolepiota fuliginosa MF-IS2]